MLLQTYQKIGRCITDNVLTLQNVGTFKVWSKYIKNHFLETKTQMKWADVAAFKSTHDKIILTYNSDSNRTNYESATQECRTT